MIKGEAAEDDIRITDFTTSQYVMVPSLWGIQGPRAEETTLGLVKGARAAGKKVIVFAGGDLEPVLPFDNAILFHPGPTRAPHAYEVGAVPYFHEDRLAERGGKLVVRPKSPKPVIGFCGQASRRFRGLVGSFARTSMLNARARIGTLKAVPPPLHSPVALRRDLLARLAHDDRVDTHFIVRDRYRAGVGENENKENHPTSIEFIENILQTDYTLCVRGTGNFSARLYETLCLGRIPVLVETDGLLPYEGLIDWNSFCVIVQIRDRNMIATRIADFHRAMSDREFEELQKQCREFWLTHLYESAYVARFPSVVRALGNRKTVGTRD